MSTLTRRFARQGRKDDKTTLERVRDTNRGIKEGVKEAKEGRESIPAARSIPSINRDAHIHTYMTGTIVSSNTRFPSSNGQMVGFFSVMIVINFDIYQITNK